MARAATESARRRAAVSTASKVQSIGRARGDQRFNFADDLGVERRFEPPFWAALLARAPRVRPMGPMPRIGPAGASAAGLVAAQVLHREGPPSHRLRLRQFASEVPNSERGVVVFRHGLYFALL